MRRARVAYGRPHWRRQPRLHLLVGVCILAPVEANANSVVSLCFFGLTEMKKCASLPLV
jgi:hypothetical protein